jgi:hypothetical protein
VADNRKNVQYNCDKSCTDLKERQKRRWKFYATNQVYEDQCIGLTGEFHVVKSLLLTASAICEIKTEFPGIKSYRNPRRICQNMLIFLVSY